MKRIVVTFVCFLLVWSMLGASAVVSAEKPGTSPGKEKEVSPRIFDVVLESGSIGQEEYVPGEILVGFQPGMKNQLEGLRKGLGADAIQDFSDIGVQHWKLPSGVSVADAVRRLSANPDVRFAEPNYLRYADAIPNDPLRNDLWGLHNLGQTGGKVDADIDALEAWEVRTDSPVVIGVIDSGVDYTHEDLADNIWINPGEDLNNNGIVDGIDTCPTPNGDFNCIDDDGNGYVDDLRGWDCRNDDNDPMDDYDHGTHVAGTIGAMGNNGIGVVGVNWDVQIMPLKFLSQFGSGSTADAIECINYAASFEDESNNKIVRITSNSWGGGRRSKALENAIKNSGALFVAAAGNSGSNRKMYPAGYSLDNIISVAATDHDDALWSGSNYGSWVDLAAPGVNVLSTVPEAIDPNKYASFTGTSMACPHVSGTAALVMAQFPSDTILQVKSRILDNVDVLPGLSGKVSTSGRLNAMLAVGGSESTDIVPPNPITDLTVTGTTYDSVSLAWNATGDDGNEGTAYLYDLRYLDVTIDDTNWDIATLAQGEPIPQVAGSPEASTVTGLTPDTTYHFAIKAVDEAGNEGAISNSPSATTDPAPGGAWVPETVDAVGDVGTWISMAVDGAGNPHISYADHTNKDIKYARWTGSAWSTETIPDPSKNTYRWTSIAVDTSGNAHIAYFDDTKKSLKYAQWTGSSWSIEAIEGSKGKSAGNWNSIVLDADDNPHISYRFGYDNRAGSLKYARWTGSAWVLEVVDPSEKAALGGTSIDLDSLGRPHIAYRDRTTNSLKYAYWTGSAWDIETIEWGNAGEWLMPRALALDDASDVAHVSYCYGNELHYAQRDPAQLVPEWIIELIDDTGCGDNNLVLDASGNAHISYWYEPTDDVKYAWWDGTAWVIELVDGAFSAQGWWASIGFDNTGKPMIAYTDIDNMDLKFARRA